MTSCSPSPAPGSCGALVAAGSAAAGSTAADFAAADFAAADFAMADFAMADVSFSLSVLVTSPCFLPSTYHRRSDSVEQPIFSATCSRCIPARISDSARACSAGENLRPRAGT